MNWSKLSAGAAFPNLSWPTVGGDQLDLSKVVGWSLLVLYRGRAPDCDRQRLSYSRRLVMVRASAW